MPDIFYDVCQNNIIFSVSIRKNLLYFVLRFIILYNYINCSIIKNNYNINEKSFQDGRMSKSIHSKS